MVALGGEKKHHLCFYFSREKTFSREKIKHKKKGYKMYTMLLWQLVMMLAGAGVALLGQILHRDKVTQVGSVMVFIGASAFIYSILAVAF